MRQPDNWFVPSSYTNRALTEIDESQMTETQNGQPLTIKELQKATGLSISTLRRRVRDGAIAVIQLGGYRKKLLFAPTVVDDLRAKVTNGATAGAAHCGSQSDEPPLRTNNAGDALQEFGGVTRPVAGPIPSWMRNPLLDQSTNQSKKTEE